MGTVKEIKNYFYIILIKLIKLYLLPLDKYHLKLTNFINTEKYLEYIFYL